MAGQGAPRHCLVSGYSPGSARRLGAVAFPSDDANSLVLEANHVLFKIRSNSSSIVQSAESQLFADQNSGAYIGDLFDLTSKQIGFLGKGFANPTVLTQLAQQAGVPGAASIPPRAQLSLGFTSTQTAALGPDNIPSFETLRGVTDQFPSGYFAHGAAMHPSHLYLDLGRPAPCRSGSPHPWRSLSARVPRRGGRLPAWRRRGCKPPEPPRARPARVDTAFRTRRLDAEYPYLMLDATFEKVRENGGVISMAVLIAVAVKRTGEREVVGVDVGPAKDLEFWRAFLRQLVERGLKGVRLVTSDAHLGLKQAVAEVLVGATWQRCRVHYADLRIMPTTGLFRTQLALKMSA